MNRTDEPAGALVARLRASFEAGRTRSPGWRRNQLQALRRLLTENEAELAAALREDLGKSLFDAVTTEIGFVVKEIDHALRYLRRWMGGQHARTPMMTQPGKSRVQPVPMGVVLIIGAWNYPVELIGSPLVAALAAGNAVVLKPSEVSVRTSAAWARLLPRYLDGEAVAVVEGEAQVTTMLLAERFDHILYTGNETVGRIVMSAAARHLTPVTLELGGKCPCLVDADADLAVAAARITWAKFMNAGQTCIAPDYVLVHERVLQPLLDGLQQRLRKCYGEDPARSADYGRIVNARHLARLRSYLADQPVHLGGQVDEAQRYFAPTLVVNPPLDSPLMREEIFGPILPVLAVADMAKAVAFVRGRPAPLALYAFTRDAALDRQVTEELQAGSVCINDAIVFRVSPELPFGGVGPSGMGRYGGWYGFETFSHMKAVMKRGFRFDVELRYPPYSATKLKWMRKL
ncbi:MAG: aldehyde dehydrogenase family protein [Steroidobacteraceae bacterium]